MRLLLDQGLPRSAVAYLQKKGIRSTHAADEGLAEAADAEILDYCRHHGRVVVTLDADFHMQMALSRAGAPSVIRIRLQGLRGEQLATLIAEVLNVCAPDIERGALISVTDSGIRVRQIPLLQ